MADEIDVDGATYQIAYLRLEFLKAALTGGDSAKRAMKTADELVETLRERWLAAREEGTPDGDKG